MANYRGHIVGGIIGFALTYPLFHPICDVMIAFGLCLFGALFPDLDTKSKVQMWSARALLFVLIGLICIKQHQLGVLMSTTFMIPLCVPHRGLLHEWWFLMGVAGAVGLFFSYYVDQKVAFAYAYYFFVGAFSHLLLDRRIL